MVATFSTSPPVCSAARISKEIPRLTGQAGQVQGAGVKRIPNQSESHSAFPFSMVRISTLLLCALMAVLIPESTNALCCTYVSGCTKYGCGFHSCSSHNGHTCNIFCCNCGGGRPGTSKCLPVSTLSFINLFDFCDHNGNNIIYDRAPAGRGGLCTAMALHPGRQLKRWTRKWTNTIEMI